MGSIQLNFSLRTAPHCKTVHLLGSWDNYRGQLPLSKDANKAGGWKGTFRFQGQTLRQGQRYWYYYIIDGYHISHDPARDSVVEPTTGRKLNVMDIPASTSTTTAESTRKSKSQRAARLSVNCGVAQGRPLSQSEIRSPRPTKPQETQQIRNEQWRRSTLEQLNAQFAASSISDSEDDSEDDSDDDGTDIDSDVSSNVPSLVSRSSNSSSPSSVSSASSSVLSSISRTSSRCACERYGITRAGGRVKLDCGGSRCGYSDGSDCASESDENNHRLRIKSRRHGMVLGH